MSIKYKTIGYRENKKYINGSKYIINKYILNFKFVKCHIF